MVFSSLKLFTVIELFFSLDGFATKYSNLFFCRYDKNYQTKIMFEYLKIYVCRLLIIVFHVQFKRNARIILESNEYANIR